MPRDARLYITLPIDIHRHPKLRNLPAEVKWAFVEMNCEARIADNDGRFAQEDAEFLWPAEVLAALVASHPTRPVVTRDEDGNYVIREYAEHQQTKADRERLAEISRENGRKGGRPAKPRPNPAVTQTGSDEAPPAITASAKLAGITALKAVVDSARKHTHRDIDEVGAYRIATHILAKAPKYPQNAQRYVTRSISLSPLEVQQFIDENALAVAS